MGVQESHFVQLQDVARIELQDPQAGGVVGLVQPVPVDIQVVVGRWRRGPVVAVVLGRVEVRHVDHHRARADTEVQLIEFITHEREPVILCQPGLMHEAKVRVLDAGEGDGTRL